MDENEDFLDEMLKEVRKENKKQEISKDSANSKNQSKTSTNSSKKSSAKKPQKASNEKKYKKVEKKEKNKVKSTEKSKSEWKKATVSKPPKKTKRILTVLAALSLSALVIFSAHKGNIKLPDSIIPTFQTAVTELDTNQMANIDESQIKDGDYSIFTEEQADEIIETVEQQQKIEETQENSQEENEVEIKKITLEEYNEYLNEYLREYIDMNNLLIKDIEGLELPIVGSTGICGNRKIVFENIINMNINENMMNNFNEQVTLNPGETCTILGISEDETQFTIMTQDGKIGNVSTDELWINAPDVIPSIIYKVANNDAAIYQSRDKDIPGVTGKNLYSSSEDESLNYNCYQYNEKLGRNEYVVPVAYQTAKKLSAVQKDALSQGYSLVIYETFRPWVTQEAVKDGLNSMYGDNLVNELNRDYGTSFDESAFIAQIQSKHQYAIATDCSLAKVNDAQKETCMGHEYIYFKEGDYKLLKMPSDMHELSGKSAVYESFTSSTQTKTFADSENAKLLQKLFTDNGFTPLASEWWHFNDMETLTRQKEIADDAIAKQKKENPNAKIYKAGNFAIGDCKSIGDISKIMEELEEYKEANSKNNENTIENNIQNDDYER